MLYFQIGNMNSSLVDNFSINEPGKVRGHVGQIIWAESSEIGCGFVEYSVGDNIVSVS